MYISLSFLLRLSLDFGNQEVSLASQLYSKKAKQPAVSTADSNLFTYMMGNSGSSITSGGKEMMSSTTTTTAAPVLTNNNNNDNTATKVKVCPKNN